MEIGFAATGVEISDSRFFQMSAHSLHAGQALVKNLFLRLAWCFGLQGAEFRHHVGVQGDGGVLAVFGDGGPRIQIRGLRIQVDVIPQQGGEFAPAQASEDSSDVSRAIRSGDIEEAREFAAGEGAARKGLHAFGLDEFDGAQGIAFDQAALEHPVEKTARRFQVIIEGFG